MQFARGLRREATRDMEEQCDNFEDVSTTRSVSVAEEEAAPLTAASSLEFASGKVVPKS